MQLQLFLITTRQAFTVQQLHPRSGELGSSGARELRDAKPEKAMSGPIFSAKAAKHSSRVLRLLRERPA